jgi:methanogenic corrinoid protein MtbC1
VSRPAAGLRDVDLDAYWAAVAAVDEQAAYAVTAAALDRGVPLEDVLAGLVVAAQERVGALWATNQWSVAREHAATATSETVLRRLHEEQPAPTTGPALLVACVEREWHALPALVVTLVLRARGCRATHLGASTSRDHLVSAILDTGPRAVLLSASLLSSLPRVRRQVEAVRGTGTPVVLGGGAFDARGVRSQRLGATAYAPSAEAAPGVVASLPIHVPPAGPLRHPGALESRSIEAESDAISRDVMIEAGRLLDIADRGGETGRDDWRAVLSRNVGHLVECLAGALLAEDASVLSEARTWLGQVLDARGAPAGAVEAVVRTLRTRLHDHPEAVVLLDG